MRYPKWWRLMMNFLLLWRGISLGSDALWKLKQRSVAQLSVICLLVSTKNIRFVEWPSPLSMRTKTESPRFVGYKIPLSQSLYWWPPADQTASGLWVRDQIWAAETPFNSTSVVVIWLRSYGCANGAVFGILTVREGISPQWNSLEGELLRYTNKVSKCLKEKQNA